MILLYRENDNSLQDQGWRRDKDLEKIVER